MKLEYIAAVVTSRQGTLKTTLDKQSRTEFGRDADPLAFLLTSALSLGHYEYLVHPSKKERAT